MKIKVLLTVSQVTDSPVSTAVNIASHIDRSRFTPVIAEVYGKDRYSYLDEGVLLRGLGCYPGLRAVFRLKKVLEEERPDILFSSFPGSGPLLSGVSILMRNFPKTILRFSGELGNPGEGVSGVSKLLSKALLRNAAAAVVPSETLKRELTGTSFFKGKTIKVVPHMVDAGKLELLSKKTADLPVRDRPVLTVPEISLTEPGARVLMKALDIVRDRIHPLLVILGGESAEEKLACYGYLRGNEKDVFVTGEGVSPYPYIAASDLHILPDCCGVEGTFLLEAISCGIPVAASGTASGPSSVITSGLSGLLFKPGFPEELSSSVLKFFKDSSFRKFVAEGSLASSLRYRVRALVPEYEKIFISSGARSGK